MEDLKFNLFDAVTIIPLERDGVILAIRYDATGVMYSVRFLYEGDIRYRYFFGEELELIKKMEKEEIGFLKS